MLTTEGTLLNGRVRYRQPAHGFRSGIEPVLLAASIPAGPGDHVLEAGTGAGPALLCLSARVPGCKVSGLEIDAPLVDIAAANIAENGFAGATVTNADIMAAPLDASFDHAMANPPYHPAGAPPSSDPARFLAKHGSETMLADWVARMARALRHRGTLTLIVAAWTVPACIAAMANAQCACSVLFPLWPKPGVAAKLVILRGVKAGRTPFAVHAGMVLHTADGHYTDAASAILRDAAALAI